MENNRFLNHKNYITIQGWMVDELNLKGNELLIFAIIYGFSQTIEQEFNGSLQYLSEWTNSTKQGVVKNIKSLLDKRLITKQEIYRGSIKYCTYKANTTKFNGMQQSLMVHETKFNGTVKQSLPNNIDNNIVNIIDRFVPPSLEEVEAYCKERNNSIDAESFIDYYQSKGWLIGKNKMKDWKAAIRTWERNRNKDKQQPAKPQKEEISLEEFRRRRAKEIEEWNNR